MKSSSLLRTGNSNPDFLDLIKLLDQDLNGRYGKLQKTYDQFNKLIDVNAVVVAYSDDIPAGCGSFKKFNSESVEIKRMFVKPEHRGTGIAKQIYDELEKWALESGYKYTVLETGNKQVEAIRFYTKLGFSVIENFGQYIGMETSVCMRKEITG